MGKPNHRSPKTGQTSSEPSESIPEPQSFANMGLITATIDVATGKIVDVRSIGDDGAPSELTTDRRATLSKQSGDATLEDLFEQAFEAGIACVLGDDAEGAETGESEEDVALRHQLLRPMIENSSARSLMRQEVVGRAIVGTLILKAAANAPDTAAPSSSASS